MSYDGLVYAQSRLCVHWNVYYKRDDVAEYITFTLEEIFAVLFSLYYHLIIDQQISILLILCKVKWGISRTSVASMELFVILVNGFQLLTNVTKSPILDVVVVIDGPLVNIMKLWSIFGKTHIFCVIWDL